MSEYAHAYPAVKGHYDGNGWRTDVPAGNSEGLLWVVRTQETIDRRNHDEAVLLDSLTRGAASSEAVNPPVLADEYVLADRVELREGHLIFELGTPGHNVAVKVYAPGYWREFHLLGDAREMASRTATMLKEDEDG